MLRLIAAALAYRTTALVVAHGALLSFCLFVSLRVEEADRLPRLAGIAVFGVGLFLGLWNWTREQQERRLLAWLPLPVSLVRLQVARLVVPLVLQGSLLPTAAVAVLARAPWRPLPGAAHLVGDLLAGQAFSLILLFLVYLGEELSLAVRRSKVALVAVNLGIAGAAIVGFAAGDPGLFSGEAELATLGVAHGIVALLAGLCLALFLRRDSHLVGISPIHGFPEDWSTAQRSGSR